MQQTQAKHNWRTVKKLDRALELVDYGVMLMWKDAKPVVSALRGADLKTLVEHLAHRLAERYEDRLATEIALETLLGIISHQQDENMLEAFFQKLFKQRSAEEACRTIVEIACSSEATDLEYDDEMFSLAVVLICELGLSLRKYNSENPNDFENVDNCLEHIATYLLSVSNCNNHCVRLSLIAYFGRMSDLDRLPGQRLNKILHRFGQTILDGLMLQLFDKRSESIALQFLRENLYFWLDADVNVQRIIHESFKHYMLKNPERFSLFLQAITNSFDDLDSTRIANIKRVYSQHLGALFQVADEVGHHQLGKEVLQNIVQLQDPHVETEILQRLRAHPNLRSQFKEMISSLLNTGQVTTVASMQNIKSKGAKRGRKPSMAKTDSLGTREQVAFLGARIAKAS